MSKMRKVVLTINGAERMFLCDPEQDTLADVLRRLGLTGTKVGCGTGQCGACSVILDGKVVRSCARKMKAINDGSTVTTIEGIGTAENLHPLQLAWIVYGGVQCGFCSPGFIVSAKGLLDENPNPTREEVRDWFQKNRNACRCTGYKPLVDAVMAAAQVLQGKMTMDELSFKMPEDGRIYNTRYPRPAALAKVLGTCDFGDDIAMKMPDALHAALVLPNTSHANIINIDTSEAEKMPGVVKVVTSKDVQGINRITMPVADARSKTNGFEHPILMDKKVFRWGDPVAVVLADTRRNARAAAKLVKVDYEQLPEYLTALDAMADDAMEVHPGIPNIMLQNPVFKGEDTRKIMEESAYVVEGSFFSTRQPHLPIEPDVAQAYIDDEGILTIHCKSLSLFIIPNTISAGIGFPKEKIRVIENPTGASFGYSISPTTAAIMAVCTMAVEGRPVTMTLSYDEHMHFTGKRSASYSNGKLACDENGKITAMEYEIAFDKGAYSETASMIVQKGQRFFGAPYTIPNAMGLSKAAVSNHAYSTAYRGFGSPQTYTGSEQLIDMLAEKAGIDPLEMRAMNVYKDGDVSLNGNKFNVYPMTEIYDRLRPVYKEYLESAKKNSTADKKRGVGVVSAEYNSSGNANDNSEVDVGLNPDGTVTCYNTWEDQGQGADIGSLVHMHEAFAPLGLKPEQIKLVMNDTFLAPATGAAAASRSHYMAGLAIHDGAKQLMDAMRKPDGTYRTYDEMIKEEIPVRYRGRHNTGSYTVDLDPNTGEGNPSAEYTFGAYVTEVEVDVKTGKTKVLRMHCVCDVGIVGNFLAVEGQAYGGMMHCIGFALSEDYSDVKKHTSLIGAGFPFIADVPDALSVEFVETPRPMGPSGSCGCAEIFQSSAHVAIINAINNAVGVRIHDLPATPEKVKAAMEAKAQGKDIAPAPYYMGGDFYEMIDEIKANPVTVK